MFFLAKSREIRVGRLGCCEFSAGFYGYVGSALGPGGLRGRLSHHLQPSRRLHWHIDFLRRATSVVDIWLLESDTRREHDWAALLRRLPGATIPMPRFGASDCACPSHLFYFDRPPSLEAFQELATGVCPDGRAIYRQPVGVPPADH